MALELANIAKINCVGAVIFFNGPLSNFVILFVGIISWPSLITARSHEALYSFGP